MIMKDTVKATVELEVEADWSAVEVGVAPLTIETPTTPARRPSSGVLFADRSRRAVTDWLPPGRGP